MDGIDDYDYICVIMILKTVNMIKRAHQRRDSWAIIHQPHSSVAKDNLVLVTLKNIPNVLANT